MSPFSVLPFPVCRRWSAVAGLPSCFYCFALGNNPVQWDVVGRMRDGVYFLQCECQADCGQGKGGQQAVVEAFAIAQAIASAVEGKQGDEADVPCAGFHVAQGAWLGDAQAVGDEVFGCQRSEGGVNEPVAGDDGYYDLFAASQGVVEQWARVYFCVDWQVAVDGAGLLVDGMGYHPVADGCTTGGVVVYGGAALPQCATELFFGLLDGGHVLLIRIMMFTALVLWCGSLDSAPQRDIRACFPGKRRELGGLCGNLVLAQTPPEWGVCGNQVPA